jgi:hypothetical protein
MRQRHVVVLFQHRLFGEAIARALRENSGLDVTTFAIAAVTPERLAEFHADAIVFEDQPSPAGVRTSLLDSAPALTFIVGPEANTAEVYQRHEVIEATAGEIARRIIGNANPLPRRRAPTARSPSIDEEGAR